MKVLYLNPDRGIPVLGDKGASVHVREFVTALSGLGHEVALVCANLGADNAPPPASVIELPPDADAADLLSECARLGLAPSALADIVTRREVGRLAYDRVFSARVMDALDAIGFRPDLIYERYALFHAQGAALAARLGVPRLLEVNAPLVHEQERFRGLALKAVAVATERASFHGANTIVAVSEEVAAYVRSTGVPQRDILVLPNGVDTSRFHPGAGGVAVRARFGFGDAPVIGFVGSFKPWHGVHFLIDAFEGVARRRDDARLLCVGEGPELASARSKVASLGLEDHVVFAGRAPHADIPAYLAAMDICTAPYLPTSDFYFSPMKVVEALAAGVPVVATRIGQLPALVEDGVTGLLFTPGDTADFSARLLDLLDDETRRRAMGLAARERALADFSWLQAVERAMDRGQRLIDVRRAA